MKLPSCVMVSALTLAVAACAVDGTGAPPAGEALPTSQDQFAVGERSLALEAHPSRDGDALEIMLAYDDGIASVQTLQVTTAELARDTGALDEFVGAIDGELLLHAQTEVMEREPVSEAERIFWYAELAILGMAPAPAPEVSNSEGSENVAQAKQALCAWTSYAICYWGNVEHMGFLDAGTYCGGHYGCCC